MENEPNVAPWTRLSQSRLAALFLGIALLAAPLTGAAGAGAYFRAEDAADYAAAVASVADLQRGELYTMTWRGDCHVDRVLAAASTNSAGMLAAVCSQVLDGAPLPKIVTGFSCSAFAATNAAGQAIVGRNFDYRYPMAHVLLFSPQDAAAGRTYASVGTVDGGFAGFDAGSLTNLTDQTRADYPWHAALFPYLCMDGMNETGFSVSILSLDARPDADGNKTRVCEQFVPARANVVPSLALRCLLDRAGSTAEGVAMLTNFNMFAASGPGLSVQANYHFFLNDPSGDARVVEWLPPQRAGESWIPFVTNVTAVSNFTLADGYGHGSNRWEILRRALTLRAGRLDETDAMNLCRAAAQRPGADQTSWTHWSVVYNLADRTARLATLGNYDEIFPYRIASDRMTVGAAESARLPVETNLPPLDPGAVETGKVYVSNSTFFSSSYYPSAVGSAGVSAVNRSGCVVDASTPVCSYIMKCAGACNSALVYVASSVAGLDTASFASDAVAGINDKGIMARVVRLSNGRMATMGEVPFVMCDALVGCNGDTVSAYAMYMNQFSIPLMPHTGIVITDAKGNVAVWPAGSPGVAKLCEDDASELMRHSLDLRGGIYEADGDGRGAFDELPGLLGLASTTNTRAVVSMGHGHIDVKLPGTNVLWRASLENYNAPAYGVVAEPTAVPHATATLLNAGTGTTLATNNRGRIIAETNALLTVRYAAETGYYFQNGTDVWEAEFRVGSTVTTPPTPEIEPRQLVPIEYINESGEAAVKEVLILSSHSQELVHREDAVWLAVTNEVVLAAGLHLGVSSGIIIADGAHLTVRSSDLPAITTGSGLLSLFGQRQGTGRLSAYGGKKSMGIYGPTVVEVYGGTIDVAGDTGRRAFFNDIGVHNCARTVRAGDCYLPRTVLGKNTRDAYWTEERYVTIAPEIPAEMPSVEHATRAVYVYGNEAVEGMVWSNHTATVVYTADDGYRFADGSTAITNALDTTRCPATVRDGEIVPDASDTPTVKLGVVAQRYPWNGLVDVNYKVTHTPLGAYRLKIRAEIAGVVKEATYFPDGVASGTGMVAFDLRAVFGEVKGQARFTASLEKIE